MSDITYTFKKMAVLTDPSIAEKDNVIKKVIWQMIFTDGVSESNAAGETIFDTSNLDNFIAIDEVSDSLLFEWIINKEGGQPFIDMLSNIHQPFIEKKTAEANLVEYYVDEDYNKLIRW